MSAIRRQTGSGWSMGNLSIAPLSRALDQDAHLIAEVDPQDLVGTLACPGRRLDHLGLPHGRLRLGYAAEAVALDTDQLQDGGLTEPGLDRGLDQVDV